jgi:hypothetical protein
VFGKRLGGSVLGFALGNSASSTAVRGMETVNASAAQVQSGSSIYDFVVKVLLRRTHEELLPFPSLACSGIQKLGCCSDWLQDIGDNDVEMSQYKGKVLLIVNVASAW